MKKIIFVAVVLATTMGVFGTSQAFWGFSKKAKKVEVKTEQAENNSAALGGLAFTGESDTAKITITKAGEGFKSIVGGAKVISNVSGLITTEISFGSSKVNLTVKTNAETKVYKAYDGRGKLFTVAEIAVGDNISLDGVLDTTTTALTITAKKIKDFSAQSRDANYSGTIKSISLPDKSFVLDIPGDKDLTVFVDKGTTTIIHKLVKKYQEESLMPITFVDLVVNDVVKSATGVANTQTMQLIARKVVVTERDISQKKVKDLFATIATIDHGNSMVVETTAGMTYTVSFKAPYPKYYKWTISKKYSGVKKGKKTDGVTTEVGTAGELGLVIGDKVWIDGTAQRESTIQPTVIHKEFYK
ncbi:MAG: hypothetical protein AAB962_02595 [Patescibacteria group bacterium]